MKIGFYSDNAGNTGDFHPAVKNIFNHPPGGVEFEKIENHKSLFRRANEKLGRNYPNIRNVKAGTGLVFSANSLIGNGVDWISWEEFLHPTFFTNITKFMDLYLSGNCRKVLAWTEWAKRFFLLNIPELKGKIDVLYPAVETDLGARKEHSGINVLFVGNDSNRQGLDRLKKEISGLDANLLVASNVPRREVLEKYYPVADILAVQPRYATFVYALLEAMSFGLPVVTSDFPACREIVPYGYSLKDLVEDEDLRMKASASGKKILGEKFSLKIRNDRLMKIFKEAAK